MQDKERYMKINDEEPIILEPEDWTEDEWKTILKIFGMKTASRIKFDCKFEAFGILKIDKEHVG